MKDIFLIDFDGTIAYNDSTCTLAELFVPDMYKQYYKGFKAGEINVKDFVHDLLTALDVEETEFQKALHEHIKVDPTFRNFMDNGLNIRIVSAGTNLNVKYSLETIGVVLNEKLIFSNRAEFIGKKMIIEYPYPDASQENGVDKVGIIEVLHKKGYRCIFVGDGPSDYLAALKADVVYARKGSRLVKKCEQWKITFVEFENFNELYEHYRKSNVAMNGTGIKKDNYL